MGEFYQAGKLDPSRVPRCALTGFVDLPYANCQIVDSCHIVDECVAEGAAKYDQSNRIFLRCDIHRLCQ